ncbi:GR28B protein, partial [Acromyrmex insinuator]
MLDLLSKGQVLKKWRLFQATDFQSLMYPCFIFCRILGIFPYKMNSSIFKLSKSHCVVSIVITCMICYAQFMFLYFLSHGRKYILNVPRTLHDNCYYLFSSFITIVTHVLISSRMRLLQTIMDISSKLPSKTYKKLSKLIHTKDIFSFFSFFVVIMICYYKLNFDLKFQIYTIYISLVVFQMDMLYMNCVCILKACFKRINDNLANLCEPVMEDMPHIFSRIYQQGNPFLLMELKALEKQYLMISNTVQMLNLTFSLQLLFSISLTICEVTFYLYFYITKWCISILRNDEDFISKIYEEFLFWYFLISIIYQFLKMASIIWACETGKNQALEIGTTIHIVFNSTNDENVKDELQLFSLQILHHKSIFSAKGVNMDATLLVAIISNITTYVLILLQFLVMSSSYERNNILRE